jgi:hypothetical protein
MNDPVRCIARLTRDYGTSLAPGAFPWASPWSITRGMHSGYRPRACLRDSRRWTWSGRAALRSASAVKSSAIQRELLRRPKLLTMRLGLAHPPRLV